MLEVTGTRHWQWWGSLPGGLTADGPAGGDGREADLAGAAGGMASEGNGLVPIFSDLPAV